MEFSRSDKTLVDQILHETVSSLHQNPHLACYAYAMLGSMALNQIIGGKMDFIPQSGGRTVKVAPDPGDGQGPLCLELDPSVVRNGKQEFHHWILRLSTKELIDFSTRHVRKEADDLGLPWRRGPVPKFLWHNVYKIADDFEMDYRPDQGLCDTVHKTFMDFSKGEMPGDFRQSLIDVLGQWVKRGGRRDGIEATLARSEARDARRV